jgi:signal transduction histidine kinase
VAAVFKFQRTQRREALIALASLFLFALLLLSLLAIELSRTHHNVLRDGYARAENLVRLLEEQTRRTAETLDFTLDRIANRLTAASSTPAHEPQFSQYLRDELARLVNVRALFVVGADGFILQDTDVGTPNVSLADRDYFKAAIDPRQSALYIGQPLKSRSTQIGAPWFLSASKAIRDSNGNVSGVAVAAVEPKYFSRFYARLGAGGPLVVALVHNSGLVVARYPEISQGVGSSLAGQKLFTTELKKAPIGTYSDTSKLDGITRLYAYRLVSPFPLLVVVGLNKSELLADWYHQATLSCAAVAAFLFALAVGAFFLLRGWAHDRAIAEHMQNVNRLESLGHIAGAVAHDFNNLLSIISGNVEMALAKASEADPSRVRLSRALEAVQKGARMSKDLLALAKNQPADVKTEDLCAMLSRDNELLREAAWPCQLKLTVPKESCRVLIDANNFARSLMNLVVNARHATKGTGTVSISAQIISVGISERARWPDLLPGGHVACSVQDDGEGISAEMLPRIFEPFFTTKPDGLGTGLGLSQVFRFARQSQGGVYSKVGVGTTVTLILPLCQETAEEHGEIGDARVVLPS